MAQSFEQQVEKELKSMDQRLYDLEEKMTSIDTKLTQVVDAIIGNAITKSGGFVKDIDDLKEKIKTLEEKLQEQETFKKKFTWTIGIIVATALVVQYFANLYSNLNK
jgi:seryl-tRNA synthetase